MAQTAPDDAAAPVATPTLVSPAQAVTQAKATLAATQTSLAPLFADLSRALTAPGLPRDLRAAISQVLALQMPGQAPPSAETVRQAVSQSGLFLEARLAQGLPMDPAKADLKAALLVLQGLLGAAGGVAAPRSRPAGAAPPTREGSVKGQPPAAATLPSEPDAIVQQLHEQAKGAVSRQTLHQLASVPDGPAAAWMFEIPIATPQGAALAQFEIERDAPEADRADEARPPTWRARFSIDTAPLGPVHVDLILHAGQTAVSLWAERPESLGVLREHAGELRRELPGEITFRAGAPQRPAGPPGRFLDRSA